MNFSPLYELRRGKWANASYIVMMVGMLVVSALIFFQMTGLGGIVSAVTLVVGFFFGSLSGWAKSHIGSSTIFHYWLWGIILGMDALRAFTDVFIPWATQAPHWVGMIH